VIVTGAGSGIGRATAVAFAQAGANVLGVGRREANLHDTANTHPAITAFAADICADGAPTAVINEAIGRWGRIDVLVNNAGAAAAWLRCRHLDDRPGTEHDGIHRSSPARPQSSGDVRCIHRSNRDRR
jgi:NADP-dependent 3-hydroxy acid dehydrogenase YdfG